MPTEPNCGELRLGGDVLVTLPWGIVDLLQVLLEPSFFVGYLRLALAAFGGDVTVECGKDDVMDGAQYLGLLPVIVEDGVDAIEEEGEVGTLDGGGHVGTGIAEGIATEALLLGGVDGLALDIGEEDVLDVILGALDGFTVARRVGETDNAIEVGTHFDAEMEEGLAGGGLLDVVMTCGEGDDDDATFLALVRLDVSAMTDQGAGDEFHEIVFLGVDIGWVVYLDPALEVGYDLDEPRHGPG